MSPPQWHRVWVCDLCLYMDLEGTTLDIEEPVDRSWAELWIERSVDLSDEWADGSIPADKSRSAVGTRGTDTASSGSKAPPVPIVACHSSMASS